MSKNIRTLEIYTRLCEGKVINKTEEAERYHVDERSIQRDITDIRSFLADRAANDGNDDRDIVFDKEKKGYVIEGEAGSLMTNSEILAVSKILLASRTFTKKEISGILDKLIAGCVPLKNMQMVSDLIRNEKYHYVEPHHKSKITDKLWELGEDIENKEVLCITYKIQASSDGGVTRYVIPIAVLFSEYYFYLNAFILEKNEKGNFEKKYEYPAIFRIDRIKDFKGTGESFSLPYSNRFEEGEFRKRIQFMYAGLLMRIRLRIASYSVEAVLDRLPTANIVKEEDEKTVIEAEVYGKGILMWIMSQGKNLEVLSPESLRHDVKSLLNDMMALYQD